MATTIFKYNVIIAGGIGENTWDKEIEIEAVDILQALHLALAQCPYDGTVVSIEQAD